MTQSKGLSRDSNDLPPLPGQIHIEEAIERNGMKPIYVIIEKTKDGKIKFFNGVLTKSSYNKDVKIRVYKYRKTAENNLREYMTRYEWGLEHNRNNAFRDDLGELEVIEYMPSL